MTRSPGPSTSPATRGFRWRNFAVTVTVPGRVAALARRRAKQPADAPVLEIAKQVPRLNVVQRDVEQALGAGRTPEDEARTAATNPDGLPGEVAAVFAWYHTIELPGGVVTPGVYDHRPLLPHYGIPDDLTGKRVLDVATFDGSGRSSSSAVARRLLHSTSRGGRTWITLMAYSNGGWPPDVTARQAKASPSPPTPSGRR